MSVTKTFSIPTPVIPSAQVCEYFIVKYRKILPSVSGWTTLANLFTNTFSLTMDDNSKYEIAARHHCCDDGESGDVTIQYDTTALQQIIYVCLRMIGYSNSCATATGSCRDCTIVKTPRLYFFADAAGTTPLDVTGMGLVVKYQINTNGVAGPIQTVTVSGGVSKDLSQLTTYEEICNPTTGWSAVNERDITLIGGASDVVPYNAVACPNMDNNPTITQLSNTSTGVGGIRTQVFQVGADVVEGNRFMLMVYSHGVYVTAVAGDTATTITNKLISAINSTTATQWNDHSSAPPSGTAGFKPTASLVSGNISITLNHVNQFAASAYPS